MAKHDKVTRGQFRVHDDGVKECADCYKPPAVKMFVDDADRVRGITRTSFCADKPVGFSIGLMTYSSVRKQDVDVIRACSSHANYHVHHWHHLRVSETKVVEKYPLDSPDDVMRAYGSATANIYPRYEEWITEWSRKV
ncbi:hypothetical protein [Arthrobacter sp. OAP107]|uniref:hypothetical protein n=1 Tax=Arthrobacter sp. OAP107 TaxID=3156445 RepID=UPI00339099B6